MLMMLAFIVLCNITPLHISGAQPNNGFVDEIKANPEVNNDFIAEIKRGKIVLIYQKLFTDKSYFSEATCIEFLEKYRQAKPSEIDETTWNIKVCTFGLNLAAITGYQNILDFMILNDDETFLTKNITNENYNQMLDQVLNKAFTVAALRNHYAIVNYFLEGMFGFNSVCSSTKINQLLKILVNSNYEMYKHIVNKVYRHPKKCCRCKLL